MSWFTEDGVFERLATIYRQGDLTKFDVGLHTIAHSKQDLLISEDIIKKLIVACEGFAAISGFSCQELVAAEVRQEEVYYVRVSPYIDKDALQAAALLKQSSFFKPAWEVSWQSLDSRLHAISAEYEDHRLHPNRGKSEYDPATNEYIDLETGERRDASAE